jgi:hypothetical protein
MDAGQAPGLGRTRVSGGAETKTTQHLLLPRTVESRSRVIHVPSLAPVLPRGPVTYGPSFAFSLSELDWIKSCFQLP